MTCKGNSSGNRNNKAKWPGQTGTTSPSFGLNFPLFQERVALGCRGRCAFRKAVNAKDEDTPKTFLFREGYNWRPRLLEQKAREPDRGLLWRHERCTTDVLGYRKDERRMERGPRWPLSPIRSNTVDQSRTTSATNREKAKGNGRKAAKGQSICKNGVRSKTVAAAPRGSVPPSNAACDTHIDTQRLPPRSISNPPCLRRWK